MKGDLAITLAKDLASVALRVKTTDAKNLADIFQESSARIIDIEGLEIEAIHLAAKAADIRAFGLKLPAGGGLRFDKETTPQQKRDADSNFMKVAEEVVKRDGHTNEKTARVVLNAFIDAEVAVEDKAIDKRFTDLWQTFYQALAITNPPAAEEIRTNTRLRTMPYRFACPPRSPDSIKRGDLAAPRLFWIATDAKPALVPA